MIEIDGSYGEGGGQIIRTAVALSAITGKPVKITNIRSSRPNPGLQAQHLESVRAVARLCKGKTDARLGATSLTFEPGHIEGGHVNVDIGTAGAISLVLQALALPALHAEHPVTVRITGGTHVRWSPNMDYMQSVFGYYMKKIGINFETDIEKYGFHPKGGGIVSVKIEPRVPKPLVIEERGKLLSSNAVSIATEDLRKADVADRQINGAESFVNIENRSVRYVSSFSTGSAIFLQQSYENCVIGATATGDRGVSAKSVGESAGNEMKKQIDSGGCIDEHMADQLLPFLAFAHGNSKIKVSCVTEHALTNIWVIEQFMPVKFVVDEKKKTIEVLTK